MADPIPIQVIEDDNASIAESDFDWEPEDET